ncbi:hypothetical protein FJ964_30035 [Mesorhizobium sp. B2-3-2]|nr:hypothetical protein FJ964_30035 [Mesorhizobium sp. B2-3-2]
MSAPEPTGFGDYTETGQVIPVHCKGQHGGYVHPIYLDEDAPIAGGSAVFPPELRRHRTALMVRQGRLARAGPTSDDPAISSSDDTSNCRSSGESTSASNRFMLRRPSMAR